MSVENKEIVWNSLPDIKKLLESKDIDGALSWLWNISKNTIENKQEELAGCFEMADFVSQLNDTQTQWINQTLSHFLTPQNLQS